MAMEYYKKARHLLTEGKVITFHDAQTENGGLGSSHFDTRGLQSITLPPPVDSENEKLTKEVYYPQFAELVKKVTGAKGCFINSHLIRMPNPPSISQNPAKFAHCNASKDFPLSWRKGLVKNHGCMQEVADHHDIFMVNVWHPRDIPAYKDPLGLLDRSTVDLGHEIQDIPFINLNGEVSEGFPPLIGPSISLKHRWVFIPDQKPDEAWLFKQYDTRPGVAKQCFHNGFADPCHLDDPTKPGRKSAEFRMYLTFPKKAGSKL